MLSFEPSSGAAESRVMLPGSVLEMGDSESDVLSCRAAVCRKGGSAPGPQGLQVHLSRALAGRHCPLHDPCSPLSAIFSADAAGFRTPRLSYLTIGPMKSVAPCFCYQFCNTDIHQETSCCTLLPRHMKTDRRKKKWICFIATTQQPKTSTSSMEK